MNNHVDLSAFVAGSGGRPAAGFSVLDSGFRVLLGDEIEFASESPARCGTRLVLKEKRQFEKLLTGLAIHFINLPTAEIAQGLRSALQIIGEFARLDRCYVVYFRDTAGKIEEVYEWSASGVEPVTPPLRNRPVADFPWGLERLQGSAAMKIAAAPSAPVPSRLIIPLVCGRALIGFAGFDACRLRKEWSQGEGTMLRITAEMLANALERRRIDEELQFSRSFEKLIADISTRFLQVEPKDAEEGINFAVQALCRFVRADRCYVFQFDETGGGFYNSNDWWEMEVEPEIDRLKTWRLADFPWLARRMRNLEATVVSSLRELPPEAAAEKAYWLREGIRSLVVVPLVSEGALIGGMSFEMRREERAWETKEPHLLRTVSEIICNSLERKKAEDALHRALRQAEAERDRIDAVLGSVTDGILFADPEHRVSLLNRAAERLLGVRSRDVLGRPVTDIAPVGADQRRWKRALRPGRRRTVDLVWPAARQSRRIYVQARTSPVTDRQGGKAGMVAVLRDLSREHEIDRMKTEFISTAAHELRTPLTSIQGFTELLLQRDALSPEERRDLLSIIHEQAEALAGIIADLLDISRLESGCGLTLNRQTCDLAEMVRQVFARFGAGCDPRRLVMEVAEGEQVWCDRGKMRQVLDNLLSNAVKYSPSGTILVKAVRERDQVVVSVEDHGIGMTAEQVRRIFDKFYRADASNTAAPGIGLGMSIVRHIVEAHGGRIRVESEPGRGTRVIFTMPRPPQG